jgi:plastocyanin
MTSRSRILVAFLTGLAFLSTATAEPRKKPKPATDADIARLEKQIENQQKQIDKLVRVQQQFLASLNAAAFDGAAPPPPPPVPAVDKTPPKPATSPKADASDVKTIEAKPAVAIRSNSDDMMPSKPKKSPEKLEPGTVVGKVVGAGDAIVYIDTLVAPVKAAASMKQIGKQFSPKVLVVTRGTTVEFPNQDAIFHNVFSVTPDLSFDLGSYRQGETKSVTMTKSGVVTIYCNMHPNMVGHILVTPSTHYVRAGSDGFFRLTNVPPGNHRIVAWAPNAKPVSASANVTEGEVVTVELELKKGKAPSHTKKDGMPYGSYE